MASFTIKMKDGTVKYFPHEGRAGGSYTKRINYQPGFVIIENEWGTKTSIPSNEISEIIEIPYGGW